MTMSNRQGFTVFLTGLAGAGKSTLARRLEQVLGETYGRSVTVVDGDVVREMLSSGLTFSRADRELNIRRIGYVAGEVTRHGGICIAAAIAPYATARHSVRAQIAELGGYYEVYLSTSLAECEKRDPKGLYRRARLGQVKNFPGIDAPYETPENPELRIDTARLKVDEAVRRILALPERDGRLAPASAPAPGFAAPREARSDPPRRAVLAAAAHGTD